MEPFLIIFLLLCWVCLRSMRLVRHEVQLRSQIRMKIRIMLFNLKQYEARNASPSKDASDVLTECRILLRDHVPDRLLDLQKHQLKDCDRRFDAALDRLDEIASVGR